MILSPWPDIADTIDAAYPREYFYHQSFPDQNFMVALMPNQLWRTPDGLEYDVTETFLGTKVYNIFIAQKAYGWFKQDDGHFTFDWGDPDSQYTAVINSMIETHNLMYPRFPTYTTVIFTDFWTANEIKRLDPDSGLADRLIDTASKLREVCSVASGFIYGGDITDQVEPSFFEDTITAFFGNPAYKQQ